MIWSKDAKAQVADEKLSKLGEIILDAGP